MEVGGGTGGTTGGLLPHLPAERTRYLFTDLSAGFLNLAEQKFSKTYPFVEYRTFDLERDPLTQGFSPDSCDLILAANVLHATQDLHQTLAHLQPLLVEGGLLLALELTDPPPWVELTFGLPTAGGDSPTNAPINPCSPKPAGSISSPPPSNPSSPRPPRCPAIKPPSDPHDNTCSPHKPPPGKRIPPLPLPHSRSPLRSFAAALYGSGSGAGSAAVHQATATVGR